MYLELYGAIKLDNEMFVILNIVNGLGDGTKEEE